MELNTTKQIRKAEHVFTQLRINPIQEDRSEFVSL